MLCIHEAHSLTKSIYFVNSIMPNRGRKDIITLIISIDQPITLGVSMHPHPPQNQNKNIIKRGNGETHIIRGNIPTPPTGLHPPPPPPLILGL